jgi:hypothetical protein
VAVDHLSVQGGLRPELNLKMGKKGEETATQDVPSIAEVEGLRSKITLMEEVMQK